MFSFIAIVALLEVAVITVMSKVELRDSWVCTVAENGNVFMEGSPFSVMLYFSFLFTRYIVYFDILDSTLVSILPLLLCVSYLHPSV
jgi:hypothetical protein